MSGKKFFTSDWHAGESQAPNTHSFLRPRPTEIMIGEWIRDCIQKVNPEDTLYFIGDLAITLQDLLIYRQLPKCHIILVMGDKEYANKNFTESEFMQKVEAMQSVLLFEEIHKNTVVKIGDIEFFLSHKPTDCLVQELPSLCGHIHGIWRSAEMPNKQPIINVGIDAWGGVVTEEFILHQYTAITKHYDENAFPSKW